MTHSENPSISSLKERFRHGVCDLAGAVPLSEASLSVRFAVGAPLEAVLTLGFACASPAAGAKEADECFELAPLLIGDAAAQWFEANRRELVLDVRPDQTRSDFYRPFLLHGLESVVVLPVFGVEGLIGALAFGSTERHVWTRRHLKLMQLLAAQLGGEFPHPAPAAEAPRAAETNEPAETAEEHSLRVGASEGAPVPVPTVSLSPSPEASATAEALAKADAHVEADALGALREWDSAAEKLFGVPREDAVGRSLAFFYRETGRRFVETRLVDELAARGRFTGRILAWDAEGRELACEVEVVQIRTATGARGFRGRFRRVEAESPLPDGVVRFDIARRYAFSNPVTSA